MARSLVPFSAASELLWDRLGSGGKADHYECDEVVRVHPA
jgi:hypothetical protein